MSDDNILCHQCGKDLVMKFIELRDLVFCSTDCFETFRNSMSRKDFFKQYGDAFKPDNKAAFDGLDAATRSAVQKAAADAEARGWAASRKVNSESIDKLKANGMNIVAPSAQLKADMKKVGDTMLSEWLDKAGPDGKALVDAFRK